MVAFSPKQRDPLFDTNTQAVIEKRGRELFGIALLLAGMFCFLMLASYSVDDPNWMLVSDAPINNWMGRLGASIAAPLIMILGVAAWALPVGFAVWGIRYLVHVGCERVVGRMIFLPIAIAFVSLYAATAAPGPDWQQSFGLGGLFGDTALSILLTLVPVSVGLSVKLISLAASLAIVVLMLFSLGFSRLELLTIIRFLTESLVKAYAILMQTLGIGASASWRAAQSVQGALQRRMDANSGLDPAYSHGDQSLAPPPSAAEKRRVVDVIRMNPVVKPFETESHQDAPSTQLVAPRRVDDPAPKSGLRGIMPGLLRRDADLPQSELPEPQVQTVDVPPASQDRITAKISDAIKARKAVAPQERVAPITHDENGLRMEPSFRDARKPKPLVFEPDREVSGFVVPPPHSADTPLEGDVEAQEMMAAEPGVERAPLVAEPLFDADEDAAPKSYTAPVPAPKKVVQHTLNRRTVPSRQAQAEAQPTLQFDDKVVEYETPPLSLLENPVVIERAQLSDESLEENARMLESVLDDYGIKGEIVSVRPGPVVTMYELEPAPGLKASRVIGLADDIARSMSALAARVSTVPGRSVIGIELPNANREKVVLREILSNRDFGDTNMRLPLALGKDIGGDPVVANLAKMPHLLIAGTTGSGKSVAINTMILSLLYKLTPEECRLIMIDPKMLELSVYDGIPHLLSPVVTDPKKAVVALKWVVGEMEERYRKMSKMGVRNIEGYNGRVADALSKGELFSRTVQTGFDDETGDPVFETEEFAPEKMPYIVVIVDEMADLMMVAGKEIEACIQRLAQMARASGIHLIMATQRPSVDVITGTIKANFPTRISFQVTSKIDSRTILGEQGAEQLLGMGDMLYMAGGSRITRVHGPFVSDEEVEEIVTFLKGFGPPEYMSGVVEGPAEDKGADIDLVLGLGGNTDGEDALYDQAVAIVIKDRKCSTSYIQRKLSIGYNKAAKLVEEMEDQGVVSAANHVGKREILVPEQG